MAGAVAGLGHKKALEEGPARLRDSLSGFFSFRLFFQYGAFFLKFRTAVAVRAATDFSALGFRIAFAHD